MTSSFHTPSPARVRLASLLVAFAAVVGLPPASTAGPTLQTSSLAVAPSVTSPAAAKIAVDLQRAITAGAS